MTDTDAPSGYETIGCRDLRLIGPDGEVVNLTGLWGELDTVPYWNIHQLGNCLFLVSVPYTDATDPSGRLRSHHYQRTCEGVLKVDFAIALRCVNFGSIPLLTRFGPETWEIVFSGSGDAGIRPCPPAALQGDVCIAETLVRYDYESTEVIPN